MALMLRSKAPRACVACRNQKRRCTKELPECSLCVRNGRPCEYDNDRRGRRSQAPRRSLLVSPPSPSGNPSIDIGTPLTASYFLDFGFHRKFAETSIRSSVALPAEVMLHLPRQLQQQRSMADVYFSSVHTHLPMISKMRVYQELSASQEDLGADTALLLVTMKLHASPRSSIDSESATGASLYASAIAGLAFMETSGSQALSISVLQAALLISLYELEHAIYPAANFRVEYCVRLAEAIGRHQVLRPRQNQMLGEQPASSGMEETRRVWWAIGTLRTYVNIDGPKRAAACHETNLSPKHHKYMPMKEVYWDQGIFQEPQLFKGSLVDLAQTNISPLGRTYQATYLLCRVFHHVNHRRKTGEDAAGTAVEIHQSIQDVLTCVLQEADLLIAQTCDATAHLALAPSAGLLISALFGLFNHYSCPSNFTQAECEAAEIQNMQDLVRRGVRTLPIRVAEFAQRIEAAANLGGASRISPLICDALYQAAATRIRYAGKTPSPEDVAVVVILRRVLTLLGGEWNLPVVYDEMLEHAINSLWLEEGEQSMGLAD